MQYQRNHTVITAMTFHLRSALLTTSKSNFFLPRKQFTSKTTQVEIAQKKRRTEVKLVFISASFKKSMKNEI